MRLLRGLLVTYRGGWSSCPRRSGFRYVDLNAPEDEFPFWDATCGAHTCPYCVETNVWRHALAIEHSVPERFAVFTGLPSEDWQANRAGVNALVRAIRRGVVPGTRAKWVDPRNGRKSIGYSVATCYTIEAGKKTGMIHVNFLWHGGYIPQAFLSETAESIGWGKVVHVQDVRKAKSAKATSKYGLKEASGVAAYGLKEATGKAGDAPEGPWLSESLSPVQAAYLARNGGQLVHASKGFWRDGPDGATLGSAREAFRAAMRQRDTAAGVVRTARETEWVLSAPSGEVMAHRPLPLRAPVAPVDSVQETLPGLIGDSGSALPLPSGW